MPKASQAQVARQSPATVSRQRPVASTPRVVVAMSGGVDSSLAAALLVEAGYQVIGVMMRLWAEVPAMDQSALAPTEFAGSSNKCCSLEAVTEARRVADLLNIPFYLINVEQPFKRRVVDFTIDGYLAGRTPNPCVECNRHIRFDYLFRYALSLGADFLATGHYARVRGGQPGPAGTLPGSADPAEEPGLRRDSAGAGSFQLLMGLDRDKDQSYVLHVLTQQHLAHVLFPVGVYTKADVRRMAAERGLPAASRRESQDLCFLADGDYRRFLRTWSPAGAIQPGPIVDSSGRRLGEHQGLCFYTIGQRKGLGIAAGEPLYVLRLEPDSNTLVVGPAAELGSDRLRAHGVNWVSGTTPAGPLRAQVKIRYMADPVPAVVTSRGNDAVEVCFDRPVRDITPGQSAVFYDGEICLGGGVIE